MKERIFPLKDIALTIGQYLSTEERPICDWEPEEQPMPQGFMNERVNMSDWEGTDKVGGVFNGSCWSETSNLLALAEVIPLLNEI